MDSTPRPQWRATPRPPLPTRNKGFNRSGADEESRLVDEWRLARVQHRMDDALEYMRVELLGCSVGSEVVHQVAKRIKRNLLSEWAKDVLYSCCECHPPNGVEQFLETEFDVLRPRSPREGSSLVAIAVELPEPAVSIPQQRQAHQE